MDESSVHEISGLLDAWHNGDDEALQKLIPLVHEELHHMARRLMHRERKDHILQTTALLNEAFMRLLNAKQIDWNGRSHFFAISVRLMHQILIDWARKRPHFDMTSLPDELSQPSDPDLVALDDALTALSEFDPQKAESGGIEILRRPNHD